MMRAAVLMNAGVMRADLMSNEHVGFPLLMWLLYSPARDVSLFDARCAGS